MDRFKMFNSFFTIVMIAISMTGIIAFCIYYEQIKYEYKNETNGRNDTIYVYIKDSSAVAQIDSLYSVIDSLESLNYKYEDELNIVLFKLERIRYYNDIAKNGNNIKYLRGWINRTLDD